MLEEKYKKELLLIELTIAHYKDILTMLTEKVILITDSDTGPYIPAYPLFSEDNEYIRSLLKDHYIQKLKQLESKREKLNQDIDKENE